MKNKYPKPRTIVLVFFISLAIFQFVPSIILGIPAVSAFFYVLGGYNARLHSLLLGFLGVESRVSSNNLYLSAGPVAEYSPYCFGFLAVAAFAVLIFILPAMRWIDKVIWVMEVSVVLLMLNQVRILFELLLASNWPAQLSLFDRMFYPLLPLAALALWHRALKIQYNTACEGGHARG